MKEDEELSELKKEAEMRHYQRIIDPPIVMTPGSVHYLDNPPCFEVNTGMAKAVITAALIIAIAMLGCAVIDYYTFREVPEEYIEDSPSLNIPIYTSPQASFFEPSLAPGESAGDSRRSRSL